MSHFKTIIIQNISGIFFNGFVPVLLFVCFFRSGSSEDLPEKENTNQASFWSSHKQKQERDSTKNHKQVFVDMIHSNPVRKGTIIQIINLVQNKRFIKINTIEILNNKIKKLLGSLCVYFYFA